jgi:hypothetical protein
MQFNPIFAQYDSILLLSLCFSKFNIFFFFQISIRNTFTVPTQWSLLVHVSKVFLVLHPLQVLNFHSTELLPLPYFLAIFPHVWTSFATLI